MFQHAVEEANRQDLPQTNWSLKAEIINYNEEIDNGLDSFNLSQQCTQVIYLLIPECTKSEIEKKIVTSVFF